MQKLIFLPIFFFVSCELFEKKDTGYEDSSPIVVVDEITKLKDEIIKLKAMDAKLISDTQYKAKQIVALKKSDSIYNVKINSEAAKLSALTARYIRDSTLQWVVINLVPPLTPKVNSLTARYIADSAKKLVYILPLISLPSRLNSLTNRYIFDSTKKTIDINKLKSVAPVTQIPIMQADITSIKAKNVSQDKILVANTSSIQTINDTISFLKVNAGTDFALDSNRTFQISPSGMVRIKETIVPQP